MKAKNVSEPVVALKEGADPTAAIDRLYRQGRTFPVRQPVKPEPSVRARSERDETQRPQSPEDKQAPGYDNDVGNNWLRGANEDATTKPGFDKHRSGG